MTSTYSDSQLSNSDAFHSCPSQLEVEDTNTKKDDDNDESDNESQALLSPVNEEQEDQELNNTNNNHGNTTQDIVTHPSSSHTDIHTAASASASTPTNSNRKEQVATPPSSSPPPTTVTDLWNTLYAELHNVGKSMSCPLCLSTYQNPVLLPCVHAFCKGCMVRSFDGGRKNKCPICNQTATKRSMVDAPSLQNLATAYKHVLRSFGMTPIVYDPDFIGLTQLPPEDDDDDDEEDDEEEENQHEDSHTNKKKHDEKVKKKTNPSLLDCHTHLEVSKTWHRVLSTTQQNKNNTQFLLKEQERVLKADEKALVRAAVRQTKRRTTSNLQQNDKHLKKVIEKKEATNDIDIGNRKKNPTMVSFAMDTTIDHDGKDDTNKINDSNVNTTKQAEEEQTKLLSTNDMSNTMNDNDKTSSSNAIVETQNILPVDSLVVEEHCTNTTKETTQNETLVEPRHDEEKETNQAQPLETTITPQPPTTLGVDPLPPPTMSQLLEESRDREAADQSAEEWIMEEQQQQQQQEKRLSQQQQEEKSHEAETHDNNINKENVLQDTTDTINNSGSSQSSTVVGNEKTAQRSLAKVHDGIPLQSIQNPPPATTTIDTTKCQISLLETTTVPPKRDTVDVDTTAAATVAKNGPTTSSGSTTESKSKSNSSIVEVPSNVAKLPLSLSSETNDPLTAMTKQPTTRRNANESFQTFECPKDKPLQEEETFLHVEQNYDTIPRDNDNHDDASRIDTTTDSVLMDGTNKKTKSTTIGASKVVPAIVDGGIHNDINIVNDSDNDKDNLNNNKRHSNKCIVEHKNKMETTEMQETAGTGVTTTTTTTTTPLVFAVGDVVQVQARTWPGVNKQGGVGRITKVHVDDGGGGMVSYDVTYVLGGREKRVDATFVNSNEATNQLGSTTTTEITTTITTTSNRKRSSLDKGSSHGSQDTKRRLSGRKSRRITSTSQKKEQDEIPPQLLAELAAAGFDTGITTNNKSTKSKKQTTKTVPKGKAESRVVVAHDADMKPKATKKQSTSSTAGTQKVKRKFGGIIHQKDVDMKNNRSGNLKSDQPPVKKRTKVLSFTKSNKTTKTKVHAAAKTRDTITTAVVPLLPELPPLTDTEKCKLANDRYHDHFTNALKTSVITVVPSGLSEQDKEMLQVLCKQTKKGTVKIKLAKELHPHKTTICIVPLERQELTTTTSENAVSRNRTLKAMRAQLAGIPIVSPAWVTLCIQQERVVEPTSLMYIRTLPTKTQHPSISKIQLGVANHAARLHQLKKGILSSPPRLSVNVLENVFVFLCGKFDVSNGSPRKADVTLLLRESGATMVSSNSMLSKKLNSLFTVTAQETLVLLCDASTSDDQCGLSDSLAVACKKSYMELEKINDSGRILVVSSHWLFDSISCGMKTTGDAYEPSSPRCKDLWKVCQTKTP